MQVGTSRDFRIAGRDYRDTLVALDVHQISNPATGAAYGEVIQIPADGRTKGYWLAGPNRERFSTWTEAVQSVRAQYYERPALDTTPTPAVAAVPVAPESPLDDTKPDGWLWLQDAAPYYGLSITGLRGRINKGVIPTRRIRCLSASPGFRLAVPPPPTLKPTPPTPIVENGLELFDTLPPGFQLARDAAREYGVKPEYLPSWVTQGKLKRVRIKVPLTTRGWMWAYGPLDSGVVPAEPVASPVKAAAAEVTSAPEPKITIRPAHTKVRELEAQLAELQTRVDALTAASKRQSWLDRIFGGRL